MGGYAIINWEREDSMASLHDTWSGWVTSLAPGEFACARLKCLGTSSARHINASLLIDNSWVLCSYLRLCFKYGFKKYSCKVYNNTYSGIHSIQLSGPMIGHYYPIHSMLYSQLGILTSENTLHYHW